MGLPSRAVSRLRFGIAAIAIALLAAACSPASAPESTTITTTVAPTTTATSTTTTTIATTTTTQAPVLVTAVGDLPAKVLEPVAGLYSWLADERNPEPAIPRPMLRALRDIEHPVSAEISVTGVTRELATGDSVAVVHVGDDELFLVKDSEPWRIAGATLDGQEPWLGGTIE